MQDRLLRLQHEMAEARINGQHRRALRTYRKWQKEWEGRGRPEDESWHSPEVQKVVIQISLNNVSEEMQIAKRLRVSVKGNFYLEVTEEEQAKQQEQDYQTWWHSWFFRRHEIDNLQLLKPRRRTLLVAGISRINELQLFERYGLISNALSRNTIMNESMHTSGQPLKNR